MRRVREDERGFTLTELLVSTAIGLIVIGAATMLVTSALSSEPRTSSRSSQIESGRVMLERITRELRQGCTVTGTGNEVTLLRDCDDPADEAILYSCEAGTCTRQEGTGATPEQLVTGLDPTVPVFVLDAEAPEPSPYVAVQLSFPRAEGGEAVTLSDGAAMRNFSLDG